MFCECVVFACVYLYVCVCENAKGILSVGVALFIEPVGGMGPGPRIQWLNEFETLQNGSIHHQLDTQTIS